MALIVNKTAQESVKGIILFAGIISASVSQASGISGQGTWETTLLARDLDSDPTTIEAYYDADLNITWLADANAAGGILNFPMANDWADAFSLGGYTNWRLPNVIDTGAAGCDEAYTGTDCGWNVDLATGEMAHMFYVTLGNTPRYDESGILQVGFGLSNSGPFSSLMGDAYWTNTSYVPNNTRAWYFNNEGGYQGDWAKTGEFYSWAVHDGDIGTAVVPIPAAVWLFGSGLLGFSGFGMRRNRG
jgi:hypothetical protein